MKLPLTLFATFTACALHAQPVQAVYIGHSLISDIPDMVLALAGPQKFSFTEQFTPGAPLRWQWDEPSRKGDYEPQFRGSYHRLLSANTDVLVMVDSVPRGDEASIVESIDYTTRFVDFARRMNPKMRIFWYEPWHDLRSGAPDVPYDQSSPTRTLAWRPRLKADRPKWDRVVSTVNQKRPGSVPMRLIPAGTALGEVDDAIRAGKVPGIKSMRGLFSDDIHPNPLGKYVVAMIHYRAIFGGKVTGMPYDIKGRWGGRYYETPDWTKTTYPLPSKAAVTALQKIVDSIEIPGQN